MRKFLSSLSVGAGALLFPLFALATAGTYDPITAAVDWADVVTAIVAVAALVAAVLVVVRGSRFLLAMIRR